MSGQPVILGQALAIPQSRIIHCNSKPLNRGGRYILYWMVAQRRLTYNFALQHGVDYAQRLGLPLVILEGLNLNYPHASDRLHHFIAEGMAENQREAAATGALYLPYIQGEDDPPGLLKRLAADAAVVISDYYPTFTLPRWVKAAAGRLPCIFEAVDGNGLIPLSQTPKPFSRAYDFRRWHQKSLHHFIGEGPLANPLDALDISAEALTLPAGLEAYDFWSADDFQNADTRIGALPIDHDVGRVKGTPGGVGPARGRWQDFLTQKLDAYGERRNHPSGPHSSGLSPYLHFGHISSHRILAELMGHYGLRLDDIPQTGKGSREGFWPIEPGAQAFLDQLLIWRELGFIFAHHIPEHKRYETLPPWAKLTLDTHRDDPRPYLYDLAALEGAKTHDEIWNAAQRELVQTGVMHNYLRMLWGKNIVKWTPSPEKALEIMIHLNDKYALDGRDPNSYNGIFWVLGRFDRAWGPEREVLGKVRYMTSAQAKRKLKWGDYLQRFGPQPTLF